MRVVIGSDHAGFRLKESLKKALADWGHEIDDVGTHTLDSVDYPDFAAAVGYKVAGAGAGTLGVILCGSGIGVSIAANKVKGIRAARCEEPYSAKMARQHNDANVLCMGERVVGAGVAEMTLKLFLETPFEGGRHAARVAKLDALDEK